MGMQDYTVCTRENLLNYKFHNYTLITVHIRNYNLSLNSIRTVNICAKSSILI